jgi:hypothetical protein
MLNMGFLYVSLNACHLGGALDCGLFRFGKTYLQAWSSEWLKPGGCLVLV